jgi:flagellar biosynthesis protein FliQ
VTPEFAIGFTRQGLETALLVSAPLLATGLVVGLLVSLFQALTQIHEASLAFIPKLLAMAVAAYLSAGWMIEMLLDFTRHALGLMPQLGA